MADFRGQRRLAAILNADVEDYTRLMNADEAGTLRLLNAHRGIADRVIGQHGGRVANTAGDSFLAEFPSAVDALRCALDILERIEALNQEVSEEHRLSFRVGLHVGEVTIENGDLFGDSVNIAARMQTLARPGSVCLSEAAHQFVRGALRLNFEDLGPRAVKNLDTAIRAYLAWPSAQQASSTLPPVVRRAEAHLARRFYELCAGALMRIVGPEGLGPVDFGILASLHDAPGIDRRRLAERTGLTPSRAQQALRRLVDRKLVSQTPNGDKGRRQALALTPRGSRLVMRLRPPIFAALDRIMAPLSEPERETLCELLGRVIRANDAKKRWEA